MVVGFWKISDSEIAGISIGKASGLPHAALDLFDPVAKVRVARTDVAPGVDDAR